MKSQDILDSQRSEGGEQRMRVDVNLHEISSGEWNSISCRHSRLRQSQCLSSIFHDAYEYQLKDDGRRCKILS